MGTQSAPKKAPTNAKKPATAGKGAGIAAPRTRRTDWEAVERDFRTGNFTQRELAEKYGVSHAAVGKQARENGWQKDLGEEIRRATNSRLVQELVSSEVAKGCQAVANTVLIAAEVNTQVILGHRRDVAATRQVAADLLEELSRAALLAEDQEILAQVLAGSGAQPADESRARMAVQRALSLPSRVGSVKQLADTFDKLQLAERRAFGIPTDSDGAPPGGESKPKRVVLEFVDVVPK